MIFIHIGKSKTATTSIQLGLLENRETLLKLGYLYPTSCIIGQGHHNIYFELFKSKQFDANKGTIADLLQEIKEFKKKNPAGHIIISSETLEAAIYPLGDTNILSSILSEKAMASIQNRHLKFLHGQLSNIDEVKVLFFLRRQDYYLQSFWAMEVIRMEMLATPNEYILANLDRPDLNYHQIIVRLFTVFQKQNVIVSTFEQLLQGEVLNNFLQLCGFKKEHLKFIIPPVKANAAVCPIALELIRQLAIKYSKQLTIERKNLLVHAVSAIAEKKEWQHIGPSKKALLKKEVYEQVVEIFSATNQAVKDLYPTIGQYLDFEKKTNKDSLLTIDLIPVQDLISLSIFSFISSKELL